MNNFTDVEIAALSSISVRNKETGEIVTLGQFVANRYPDDADDILAAAERYILFDADAGDHTGKVMSFAAFVQSLGNDIDVLVTLGEDAGGNHTLKIIHPPASSPRRNILSLKEFAKLNKPKKD